MVGAPPKSGSVFITPGGGFILSLLVLKSSRKAVNINFNFNFVNANFNNINLTDQCSGV